MGEVAESNKNYMILGELDKDHPLRNQQLIKIHAERRFRGETRWRPIAPNYGIAKKTFNDLSPSWTDTAVWRGYVDE